MRRPYFLLAFLLFADFCFGEHITIETDSIQLVLKVKDDGRLYQTYLGKRLANVTLLDNLDMPRTDITSNIALGNEVYPVMGSEDFYSPALEIRHADGNSYSTFTYQSHATLSKGDATETIVYLKDNLYPVKVELHYVAYKHNNIIRQWTEISHHENGEIYLSQYFSSLLYIEGSEYYLRHFGSDWAKEMQQIDEKLNRGKKVIDTTLGTRAAMFCQPYFAVGIHRPIREDVGEVLMGTLAWTGNYQFTFEVDHNNELRILTGINPTASTYCLEKNRTFKTPDFIFTLSCNGLGEGSRNFQKWILDHWLYQGQDDRKVLLNNWENTYFDFDEATLVKLFEDAQRLGVDLFLLDDGWFGNKFPRDNDHAGLGDWQVNREKLPNGIPFLVTNAAEKGLEFGLWIEPEMVNLKSELAEKHPQWIIRVPGRETAFFRNQLVLNLSDPEVQNFVYHVIDGLLTDNPNLRYLKWDCNSPITNNYSYYNKSRQGNLFVDYVWGLFNVLERVQHKYPELQMMLCSGGGGRCDLAALRYFTEFWCSDNTDPVQRLFIQWGFSQFLPAKAMCAHVTDWNRKASIKFRVDVAFPYKMGFDINLKSLDESELQYCQNAIQEYKRLKSVIYSPISYRLVSPYEGNHCVLQRTNPSKDHILLFAYDIHPAFGEKLPSVKLTGLSPTARYEVKEILLESGKHSNYHFDGKKFSGDYLMHVGLPVLKGNEMESHILEIVKK